MAYVEIHYSIWTDEDGLEHEIKLLQDGGTGPSSPISVLDRNPYSLQRRGGKDVQKNNNILGSELTFNFIAERPDKATYDAIFESNYKEWKVEHYHNSVLKWVGWLQPENFRRPWLDRGYWNYALVATDGLGNLKEQKFANFTLSAGGYDVYYKDRVTLIETIKRCLEWVELDLDFKVHLGTWCNSIGMTIDSCALDLADVDNARFLVSSDGTADNINCYDMIQKALIPFSCVLMQHDGYYWIVNPQERISYYHDIDYVTLVKGTRVAHDLTVDMSTVDFKAQGEFQRIRPLKQVDTKFLDRNIQANQLANGTFPGGSVAGWTKGATLFALSGALNPDGVNYELRAQFGSSYGGGAGTPASNPQFYTTAATALVKRGETDYIRVEFDTYVTEISTAGGTTERVSVYACLWKTTALTGDIIYPANGGPILMSEGNTGWTHYVRQFNITDDDDYFLFFEVRKHTSIWGDYTVADLRFDNIKLEVVYTDGVDVTFDRMYNAIVQTGNNFIDVLEHEVSFGDSNYDTDIGSMQVGGQLTKTWNREGKTDGVNIQQLSALNLLENFSKYKSFITCDILDPDDLIQPYSLVVLDGVDYQLVDSTVSYPVRGQKTISAQLIEVVTATLSVILVERGLSSIDSSDAAPETNPAVVSPSNHVHAQYELHLSVPGQDNYILSSTVLGVRSWVPNTLALLADTVIDTVADGEVLRWDGTDWINNTLAEAAIEPFLGNPGVDNYILSSTIAGVRSWIAPGSGSGTLDGLTDTTITTIASGELLKWNGTAWINNTLAEAGIAAASHTHVEADITDLQAYLLNIQSEPLSDLSDVTITTIASNEMLQWNGSAWINQTFVELGLSETSHNHTVASLSDVTITTIASGELLKWNGTAWINNTLAEAGISAVGHTHTEADITDLQAYITDITSEVLSGLSDVTVTTIASGEILQWNGSSWINQTFAEAGISDTAHNHTVASLSDVTITTIASGELLKWNGTAWINNTLAEASISAVGHTHVEADITDLQSYLLNITGEALSTLSDVTITTIASGELLKWNGSAWINNTLAEAGISATSHNHTVASLSDTTITSIASGEILKWNGSAWINNTLAEAGIAAAGLTLQQVSDNGATTTTDIRFGDATNNITTDYLGGAPNDYSRLVFNNSGEVSETYIIAYGALNASDPHAIAIKANDPLGNIFFQTNGVVRQRISADGVHTFDSGTTNQVAIFKSTDTIAQIYLQDSATTNGEALRRTGDDLGFYSNAVLGMNLTATAAYLRYAGVAKIQTASTGAYVTGVLNASTNLQEGGADIDTLYSDIAHTHTVSNLSDTSITSPLANNILQFNGAAWVNRTLIAAGINGVDTLNELTDTDVAAKEVHDFLKWDGTDWIAQTLYEDSAGTSLEVSIAVLPIGDWNMDGSLSKDVAHLSSVANIISITGMVWNDAKTLALPIGSAEAAGANEVWIRDWDATYVTLQRANSPGVTDSTSWDTATSFSRGYIVVTSLV